MRRMRMRIAGFYLIELNKMPSKPKEETLATKTRNKNKRKSPITPKKTMDKDEFVSASTVTVSVQDDQSTATLVPSTTARIGGRVKKAKIPFDPSVSYLPKRKSAPAIATVDPVTVEQRAKKAKKDRDRYRAQKDRAVVRKQQEQNLQRKRLNDTCLMCSANSVTRRGDKLIACIDCGYKAHRSCLKKQNAQFSTSEERNWQCLECQICFVCYETGVLEQLYKCFFCMNSYHLECHGPTGSKTRIQNNNKFRCKHCDHFDTEITKLLKPDEFINENQSPTTPASSIINNDLYDDELSMPMINVHNSDVNFDNNDYDDDNDDNDNIDNFDRVEIDDQRKITYDDFTTEYSNSGWDQMPLSSSSSSTTPPLNIPVSIRNLIKSNRNLYSKNYSKSNSSSNGEDTSNYSRTHSMEDNRQQHQQFGTMIFRQAIPDASNWSFEEVFHYFYQYFPKSAHIFKEQEIDGPCLLLMKRSDILDGLNLSLGTALKIYSHINMLQTRNNDPRLTWM